MSQTKHIGQSNQSYLKAVCFGLISSISKANSLAVSEPCLRIRSISLVLLVLDPSLSRLVEAHHRDRCGVPDRQRARSSVGSVLSAWSCEGCCVSFS